MKRLYLLLFAFLPIAVCAQNSKQEFDDFLKQVQGEFESYEKQINYEFAEALRNQWEEFQVFKGEEVPKRPKPVSIPVAPSDTNLTSCVISGSPAPIENSLIGDIARVVVRKWLVWQSNRLSTSETERRVIGETINNSEIAPKPLKTMMTFYNVPASIYVPASYTEYKMTGNTENDVADFWTHLSASDFEPVIKQIAKQAEAKGLENWSLYKYIETVSDHVFPQNSKDEKEVFTAFLANQLGLDVKIGKANESLVAMVAIAQKVYERMYIRAGEIKYYFQFEDEDLTSLRSYTTKFKEPVAQIDLLKSMPDLLSPPERIQNKAFRSSAFGCDINIPLDTNICHFMVDFPRVRCDIPAMTNVGKQFAESLYSTMYPKVKDLSQYDAVHRLMKFMHNDFAYSTDQNQFGYEKPFFCEENFFYPFNDCEDRSILFSYLIRHIMGMDVILLDYPGHIMTAVAFDQEMVGAYLDFEGKRYFVCDPTYIGSSPGMIHPDYLKLNCKILKI